MRSPKLLDNASVLLGGLIGASSGRLLSWYGWLASALIHVETLSAQQTQRVPDKAGNSALYLATVVSTTSSPKTLREDGVENGFDKDISSVRSTITVVSTTPSPKVWKEAPFDCAKVRKQLEPRRYASLPLLNIQVCKRPPCFVLRHQSKCGGTFASGMASDVIHSSKFRFVKDNRFFYEEYRTGEHFVVGMVRNLCGLYLSHAGWLPDRLFATKGKLDNQSNHVDLNPKKFSAKDFHRCAMLSPLAPCPFTTAGSEEKSKPTETEELPQLLNNVAGRNQKLYHHHSLPKVPQNQKIKEQTSPKTPT
eukprot:5399194-Amphidinium_carterae.1